MKIRQNIIRKTISVSFFGLGVTIMNSQQRSRIKRQIQAYLEKYPQAELKQVRGWLLEGNQVEDLTEINPANLKKFHFLSNKEVSWRP